MMKPGNTFKPGDVVLTKIQFTDTFEIKTRPAVVLFEEHNNVVIAGITSNTAMQGIPLTKEDGAVKESVIKLNYLFTISSMLIEKRLFSLSAQKKQDVYKGLMERLNSLQE